MAKRSIPQGNSFPTAGLVKYKFQIVNEYDGYFPVKIHALPEGSVVYPNTPVLQITGEGEFAKLTSYLETILCMVWVIFYAGIISQLVNIFCVQYPSTVATLSRRCRDTIEKFFSISVDSDSYFLLERYLITYHLLCYLNFD